MFFCRGANDAGSHSPGAPIDIGANTGSLKILARALTPDQLDSNWRMLGGFHHATSGRIEATEF